MKIRKVREDDFSKNLQEQKKIFKKKYKRKNLSFEESLLFELETYAQIYSGGSFSGYVGFLHQNFKEMIENDKSEKIYNFYDKFNENNDLKKLANEFCFGDIEALLMLSLQFFQKHYPQS
ncbi:MAG TPA: hypothetical protein DHW82_12715 [Spirochaetia bacterium]|nr:MAG: hypothetical protein A2Y41_03180 [Spirochaetes bacterium GWB1_36_13]HCL57852.1 hypothetical protein [Spirochaetia bacterium]